MNRIIKIGMDVHSKNSAGSADPVVIPHFIYIQIMLYSDELKRGTA